jgi:hypothetical protein
MPPPKKRIGCKEDRSHGSPRVTLEVRNNNRFLSLLYRVSMAGTEAAVALWYNTIRAPTVTHDNVLDSGYTKNKSRTIFHNLHNLLTHYCFPCKEMRLFFVTPKFCLIESRIGHGDSCYLRHWLPCHWLPIPNSHHRDASDKKN